MVKSPLMKPRLHLLFVLGLSLIPFLTRECKAIEQEYLKVLKSYLSGRFVDSNSLLFPYLIDYFLIKILSLCFGLQTNILVLKIVRALLYPNFISILYSFCNPRDLKNKQSLNWFILFFLAPTILNTTFSKIGFSLTETYSLYLGAASIDLFFRNSILLSSVLLGVTISSNWAGLILLMVFLIITCKNSFEDLINIDKKISATLICTLKKITMLILVPTLLYTGSFYLSFMVRDKYDSSIERYSLEFKSGFKNYNLELCDRTVVQDSIITLLHKRYQWYLSAEKYNDSYRIVGSKKLTEDCLWQIKKVVNHDGLVHLGEKIRLISLVHGKSLSLNKVNDKDKFFSLEIIDEELVVDSENDLFRFEPIRPTANYSTTLEARTTLVKLVNTNTRMDLCMRKLKKASDTSGSADMSFYSNKMNTEFYIADNKMPVSENDLVKDYPQLSFRRKFLEHHKHLFENRTLKVTPLPFEFKFITVKKLVDFLILLVMSPFLLANYIVWKRYGFGLHLPDRFLLVYLMYICSLFVSYLLSYCEFVQEVIYTITICKFLSLLDIRLLIAYNSLVFFEYFVEIGI